MNAKMYLWRRRRSCTYEGKDVIYEGEHVFMKANMYLWRRRCIYEGEDVFMKAKMYLWRRRCIYEGKRQTANGKRQNVIYTLVMDEW